MGKDIQEDKGMLQEVDRKLRLLIGAFTGILYEDDEHSFLQLSAHDHLFG